MISTPEFRLEGDGPPVLVSHGTPGGWDAALAAARLIGIDGFRRIGVSRGGYLDTPLAGAGTPEEQGDSFATVLDALDLEAAAVFAFSGGGPAAVQFALRHGDRCRGLLLASCVLRRDRRFFVAQLPDGLIRFGLSLLPLFDPFLRLFPFRILPEPFSSIGATLVPMRSRWQGFANDEITFRKLRDPQIERIECPVLLIHGTRDSIVPVEDSRWATERMPGAELLELPRAGHMAMLHPAAKEKIAAFLAKVSGEPARDSRTGP